MLVPNGDAGITAGRTTGSYHPKLPSPDLSPTCDGVHNSNDKTNEMPGKTNNHMPIDVVCMMKIKLQ